MRTMIQGLAGALLVATMSLCATWAGAADFETMSVGKLNELLQAAKGKQVVVINFFASWCPPCREELPSLVRLRKRYSPDQVLFLGLSVDQRADDLKKFLDAAPLTYPVYIADMDVAQLYGVSSIPHNTVYDKAGELVANQPGLIEERDLRQALDDLLRKKP